MKWMQIKIFKCIQIYAGIRCYRHVQAQLPLKMRMQLGILRLGLLMTCIVIMQEHLEHRASSQASMCISYIP